jgi:hypothetical protein
MAKRRLYEVLSFFAEIAHSRMKSTGDTVEAFSTQILTLGSYGRILLCLSIEAISDWTILLLKDTLWCPPLPAFLLA